MKKAKEPEPSPVVAMLDMVYREANSATSHSWGRLNHAMRSALSLAIGGGFKFELGDFKHVLANYRAGCWIGESSEWCYAQAIAENNLSAAKSYEEFRAREPFIADGVNVRNNHNSFAHMVGDRQKERLHVGASFKWQGQKVEVTSFSDVGSFRAVNNGQSYVVACSYEEVDEYRRKIKKRFKITREDIVADRAERKQRAAIMDELTKLVTDKALTAKEIADLAGVGALTKVAYDAVPLKKLAKALALAKEKTHVA